MDSYTSRAGTFRLWSLFVLAGLFWAGLLATDLQAQSDRSTRGYATEPAPSERGFTPDHSRERSRTPGVENLPEWAAPSMPGNDPQSPPDGQTGTGANIGEARPKFEPPPGTEVPVDGGVFWLAAAGGAYAIRRLSEEEEDEDQDESDPLP